MSDTRIPLNLIAVLGQVFDKTYTHAEIDRLFAYADAPDLNPGGNKVVKTVEWLKATNKHHADPLSVLGQLIEEFMEKEEWTKSNYPWDKSVEPEWSVRLREDRKRIVDCLQKAGLSYQIGGKVSENITTPSKSLQDLINKEGLVAVSLEMNRALEKVDSDPSAAAHYAANVLEACFKSFLKARNINYSEANDTLIDLWAPVRDSIGMRPRDLGSNDLKKIATGLNSIVDGLMYLRNKKSAAHGKTDYQVENDSLEPHHARLAVHSAQTLASYVIECLKK